MKVKFTYLANGTFGTKDINLINARGSRLVF